MEGETYLGKSVNFVNVVLDHIRVVSWKVLSLYEQSVDTQGGSAGDVLGILYTSI
jgi:hypothetical protein